MNLVWSKLSMKMVPILILTFTILLPCKGSGLLKFSIPTIVTEGLEIGSKRFILETIYPNGGVGTNRILQTIKA